MSTLPPALSAVFFLYTKYLTTSLRASSTVGTYARLPSNSVLTRDQQRERPFWIQASCQWRSEEEGKKTCKKNIFFFLQTLLLYNFV